TTAPKAIASSSFSQNVMRASEVPPSSAAPHSAAVATGPYTETAFIQLVGISLDGICWPTGSPDCCSCRGVMTYGLCPITAVRPVPPGRTAARSGHGGHGDVRARGRDRDHDQRRGGDGGRGEPAGQAGEPG